MILARLDRFLCNSDWKLRFSSAEAEHLAYFGSDHRPISLVLKKDSIPKMNKLPKRFTFEHKWILKRIFLIISKYAGMNLVVLITFQHVYLYVVGALKVWAGNRFDQLDRKLYGLCQELNYLTRSSIIKNNLSRIAQVKKKIEKLSKQEEVHWNQ